MSASRVPPRSEVPTADTWDLTSLFPDDAAWEAAFADWSAQADGYGKFRGRLGESAEAVAACLRFDTAFDRLGDRVGTYAFLKETEEVSNSKYQGMKARYIGVASRAAEAATAPLDLTALPADLRQASLLLRKPG